MNKKREYKSWILSQLICSLSKTPEQEIIQVLKMKSGAIILRIDGETEVIIRNINKGPKND